MNRLKSQQLFLNAYKRGEDTGHIAARKTGERDRYQSVTSLLAGTETGESIVGTSAGAGKPKL